MKVKFSNCKVFDANSSSNFDTNFNSGKHFDLFQERPSEAVYVSDIDNRGMNFSLYPILELKEVQEDYIPSKENYFDEGDCVGEERIRLVLYQN